MSAPGKSTACGSGKMGSSRIAARTSLVEGGGGAFPEGGGGGVVATSLRCRCLRRGVQALPIHAPTRSYAPFCHAIAPKRALVRDAPPPRLREHHGAGRARSARQRREG